MLLELKNVSFCVENEKAEERGSPLEIVRGISFSLPENKFLVITGPNGGGKSTLARLIMGIEMPTGGQIIFNGADITDMPVNGRAALGIGYAFQHPARFKGLTVRRLLELAHGAALAEDECCSFLTKVGLCSMDYLNREVDASLSGGELKRIEIATLMARDLSLAIYDEPEAGIDLWSFSMLVKSFKMMNKKNSRRSTIIISHQEKIMELADEIIVIADGKIKSAGPREDILPTLMDEFEKDCTFKH